MDNSTTLDVRVPMLLGTWLGRRSFSGPPITAGAAGQAPEARELELGLEDRPAGS
jgi:hypothetical protein